MIKYLCAIQFLYWYTCKFSIFCVNTFFWTLYTITCYEGFASWYLNIYTIGTLTKTNFLWGLLLIHIFVSTWMKDCCGQKFTCWQKAEFAFWCVYRFFCSFRHQIFLWRRLWNGQLCILWIKYEKWAYIEIWKQISAHVFFT